jgi:hypothetical protein
MVTEEIEKAEKELVNMVSTDIINVIYAQINGAVGVPGTKNNVIKSKAASTFGRILAKGLVGGLSKIIDKMSDPK